MESIFSVMSGINFRNSLKRLLPLRKYHSTIVFHLPPITCMVTSNAQW